MKHPAAEIATGGRCGRLWSALAGVVLALSLGGCAAIGGYPERTTDPDTDLKTLQPHIDSSAILACVSKPSVDCRDRLVAARMYAADLRFSMFEATLFRETRGAGFGASIGVLGLTSAGAVASGGASQILSGLAALLTGGREAYQKDVLAERTIVAIHTAMRSGRAEVALRMRSHLGRPLEQYPLATALSDLNAYYDAGTVLGALVGITQTVGAKAQQNENELKERFSFNPDAVASKLELMICGDPASGCKEPNIAAVERMKKECWPKAKVADGTLFLDFVLQPGFAGQRAAVAACMGL